MKCPDRCDRARFVVLLSLALTLFRVPVCDGADPIPSNRRINWRPGVIGGVPDRSIIFKTLSPQNSLAEINRAIADCPSNQVVMLAEGAYYFVGNIVFQQKSGVTLRGAGPDRTTLHFASWNWANILFNGQSFQDPNTTQPNNIVNWTGGYAQNATNLLMSSTGGLAPGTMLMLDQLNDNVDVNGVGSEGCSYCGRSAGARAQVQGVMVTGINGTNLSISPGIYMPNWSAKNLPQAWWIGGAVEMSGVENLTIDNLPSGGGINIGFQNARNCWIRNIVSSSTVPGSHYHVKTYIAANIEVSHSIFQGIVNSPGNDHYGVDWFWSWDCLAQDNIFNGVTVPLVLEACAEGNVFAYNYCTNMLYYDPTWQVAGLSGHAAHSAFNLFEGNYANSLYLDFIHGSGSHNTGLRNRLTGWEPGKSYNTYCISVQSTNHYDNLVGNILGTVGYHNTYECANGSCSIFTAIYYLGYYDTRGTYPGNYDPAVPSSVIRVGNYDCVTQSAVGGQDLPVSYYLTAKPLWFGDRPWPAFDPVNPSVAGILNLPAGYRFVFGKDPPLPITNRPPVAVASASPASGGAPLAVSFSSVGSYDPEGVALAYYWTFGDGTTSTGVNPAHVYADPGTYAAQLAVSDGLQIATNSTIVRVSAGNGNLIKK